MIAPYWYLPSKHNSNVCQALFGLHSANDRRKHVGKGIIFNTREQTGDLNKYGALNLLQTCKSRFLTTKKRKLFCTKENNKSRIPCARKSPLKKQSDLLLKQLRGI